LAFRGQYEHSLDSKDRLTVPARWRAQLAEGVVLVAGLDPCVEVYSPQAYEDFSQRFLADLNRLGRRGRMMYRRFNASAEDETLDGAGRMRLAKHLVEHAGLEGPCMVVGVADHLEVWNPERWAEHYAELGEQAEQMAEELAAGPGAQ
jgi:MraZ protein